MPSTEEAFGTAYIEAMAAGVPAIGCRGEPGPEEIAAAGGGFLLVPPGDIERLSQRIDELLSDSQPAARGLRTSAGDGQAGLHLGALRRADAGRLPGGAGACPLGRRGAAVSAPATHAGAGPGQARAAAKPVLFVTGHLPAYRVGAFARLHERVGLEVALFGGSRRHGGPDPPGQLPFPARNAGPRELYAMAAGGGYRAVVCPTAGRAALLASWAGARAGRIPVILWASLWAHPRTPAHALSYLPLRRLYRSAQAVVTYGPHVSAYVRGRGAVNVFEAPQAVDNEFWSAPQVGEPPLQSWPRGELDALRVRRATGPREGSRRAAGCVGAGRAARGQRAGAGRRTAGASATPRARTPRRRSTPSASSRRERLREVYAHADVLVVPSIPTPSFREPWGLVVNEAMNRGLAVIASDAVGAAAGGLVRDGDTGIVGARRRIRGRSLRRSGALPARPSCAPGWARPGRWPWRTYTYDAWAGGFTRALASVGVAAA